MISQLVLANVAFVKFTYVDKHCPRSFVQSRLLHIFAENVTVILCINFYTTWKKINSNHSFRISKHVCRDCAS
jgi:hypothetical protein